VHIKYLNNNSEDHVDRNLGRSLIRAGLAVEIVPPPAPPPIPVWSVRRNNSSGFVLIKMELGVVGAGAYKNDVDPQTREVRRVAVMTTPKLEAFFDGDPAFIHDRKFPDGKPYSSVFGRAVPEEIVKEYKRARRNPDACRPVSTVTDDYNKDHAATLAKMNQTAFEPVISEHESLAAAQAGKSLPVLLITKHPRDQQPLNESEGVSQHGPQFGDYFDPKEGWKKV